MDGNTRAPSSPDLGTPGGQQPSLPAAAGDGGHTNLGTLAWAGRTITSLAQHIDQAIQRILESGEAGSRVISDDDVWIINEAGKLLARVTPNMTNAQGGFALDGINVNSTMRQSPAVSGSSPQEQAALDHVVANNARSAAARQRMEDFRASAVGYLESRDEVRKRRVRELEEKARTYREQISLLEGKIRIYEQLDVSLRQQLREEDERTRLLELGSTRPDHQQQQQQQQQQQAPSPVASGSGQRPPSPGPRPPMTREEVQRQLLADHVEHQTRDDHEAQAGLWEFMLQQQQALVLQQHREVGPLAANNPEQAYLAYLGSAYSGPEHAEPGYLSQTPEAAAAVSAALNHQQHQQQHQHQPNDHPSPTIPHPPSGMQSPSTHTLATESATSSPRGPSLDSGWTEVDW